MLLLRFLHLIMFFTLIYLTVAQEVSTLLLAAWVMGDKMSLLNWLGFAMCLCGISLHVGLKALNSKREYRFCQPGRVAIMSSRNG